MSAPVGLVDNLPIAVQIVGAANEVHLFRVALAPLAESPVRAQPPGFV